MYLLGVSVLIVIWWVALWGLLEICLKSYVKKTEHALCIYTGMIFFVLAFVWLYPEIYEKLA